MVLTSSALDVSTDTEIAMPPISLILRVVFSAPSPEISSTTTFAPSRANTKAVACPIPEAPPVISATLPSSRPAISMHLRKFFRAHWARRGYLAVHLLKFVRTPRYKNQQLQSSPNL